MSGSRQPSPFIRMIIEAFTTLSFISQNMMCHFMLICVSKEMYGKYRIWSIQECVLLGFCCMA